MIRTKVKETHVRIPEYEYRIIRYLAEKSAKSINTVLRSAIEAYILEKTDAKERGKVK